VISFNILYIKSHVFSPRNHKLLVEAPKYMAKKTLPKINSSNEYSLFKLLKELYQDDDEFDKIWNDWMKIRDDDYIEEVKKQLKDDRESIGYSRYLTDASHRTPCPQPLGSKGSLNLAEGLLKKRKRKINPNNKKDSSTGKSSSPSPRRNLYDEFVNCSEESVMESSQEANSSKTMSGKTKLVSTPQLGF